MLWSHLNIHYYSFLGDVLSILVATVSRFYPLHVISEILLHVFTVASIVHLDRMASFGCVTFHLLVHDFIMRLHLTIMEFSSAYHFPSKIIPLLGSLFC